MRLGQQALELGVLRLHPAELGAPLVERRVREPALATDLGHRHAGLGLLEEPDDLFLCEFALPHVRHSPGWRTPATSGWYGREGAGQTLRIRTHFVGGDRL